MANALKTKTVQDRASLETAFDSARQDLTMLAEEMRSWADNMDGTGLENTMKYEQVEETASQLEDAQSTLEDLEISDSFKIKEVSFKYLMPKSRYIGRSWRLGQIISALRAVGEALETSSSDGVARDAILSACDDLEPIEFPGMY